MKIKYIYIEGFASLSVYVQHLFRLMFAELIKGIAGLKNPDLTICAIGGSFEGDAIMKRAGFTQTSFAFNKKTNKTYPFFEVKWRELHKTIDQRISSCMFNKKR